MPAAITPDVEALVGRYLREHDAVAALVDDRVVSRTPATTGEGWVRIRQYDDTPDPRSMALHLVAVHLQLECYGSDDPDTMHQEASLLARTVRAVLVDLPGAHDEGVVSAVQFNGLHPLPDTDFTPPRERFVLDVTVSVHP